MYSALWRLLPGPRWVRLVTLISAGIIVVGLLMLFVFPAVDAFLAQNDSAVS
jgi:hypothetical protein